MHAQHYTIHFTVDDQLTVASSEFVTDLVRIIIEMVRKGNDDSMENWAVC